MRRRRFFLGAGLVAAHVLRQGWARCLVALASIALCCALVGTTLGLYSAFAASLKLPQPLLPQASDQIVGSAERDIPPELASQALRVEGVASAIPYTYSTGFIDRAETIVLGVPTMVFDVVGGGAAAEGAVPAAVGSAFSSHGQHVLALSAQPPVNVTTRPLPRALARIERYAHGRVVVVDEERLARDAGISDRYDAVLVTFAPGRRTQAEIKDVLRASLPPGLRVAPTDEAVRQATSAARPYEQPLLFICLVVGTIAALVTIGLVRLLVSSLRRPIATARAIGVPLATIAFGILGAQIVVGLAAAALGILAAVALGPLLVGTLPGALVAAFHLQPRFHLGLLEIFAVTATGVLVGVVSGAVVLRDVSRVSAADALKSQALRRTNPVGRLARVAGRYVALLPRVGPLSAGSLGGSDARFASAFVAVVFAVSLLVGIHGATENLVSSLFRRFVSLGRTDIYVEASKNQLPAFGVFTDEDVRTVASTPGVTSAVGSRLAFMDMHGDYMLIEAVGGPSNIPSWSELGPGARDAVVAGQGVALSTAAARAFSVRRGERVSLPSGVRLPVVAVIDGPEWPQGVVVANRSQAERAFGITGISTIEVDVADRGSARSVASLLRERVTSQSHPVVLATGNDKLRQVHETLGEAKATLSTIKWLVAVAAAVMLLNTVATARASRNFEFSQAHAIGASRRLLFIAGGVDALGIVVLGGAVGIIGGCIVQWVTVGGLRALGYPARYAFSVRAPAAGVVALIAIAIPALVVSAAIHATSDLSAAFNAYEH